MSRIRAAFDAAATAGRVALIPYLTAGDPSADRTVELVLALSGCGTDVMELGVPFSDPLADGETNQKAAHRALAKGMSLSKVMDVVTRIRRSSSVPLVLFTYFNPVLRMGLWEFSLRARDAGVDGVLVTDLPVEEGDEYRSALTSAGLDAIFLAAPTTGIERLKTIGEASGGFVYYVCRTGVTGEREVLPIETGARVQQIRKLTGKKVAVGFGVSRREHVEQVATFADGVVIGSALVRVVEEVGDSDDLPRRLERRLREIFPSPTSR